VVGLGLEARRGPTAFFNRLLRRETLDYRTVARFSRQVGKLQRVESLLGAARRFFGQDLDAERVDIWLLDEKHQVARRFCGSEPVTSQPIPVTLIEHLRDGPGTMRTNDLEANGYRALLALLNDAPPDHVSVWAPLVEREQVVGILALGPRWTGEVYDDRDLELIEILAQQMALSILNTRQMARLRMATESITQAAESERRKIARELHDTILQFLLVLTYGLDDLRERRPETADEIEHWQERISVESRRLRELLNHLRAPELLVERGLIRSLEDWLERTAQDTDVAIETNLAAAAERALDVEAQVAVYRIFREAVNNALRHAQAERVSLRLWREDERVRFVIEDDGQGFDVDRALQIGGKGYSSLADMRSHAEGVDGVLRVSSAPEEGTVIGGWVAAQDNQERNRR
jgi:signal transduction histidine kinase